MVPSSPGTVILFSNPNAWHSQSIWACAQAQIDWLCQALGFENRMTVPGDDGTIAHCELQLGSGVVMLGSDRQDDLRLRSPLDLGGTNQGIYICLAEIDDHCARARQAGAEIVRDPFETP